jgi:hypothetical protein
MRTDAEGRPFIGNRRSMLGVRPTIPDGDPNRNPDVRAVTDNDRVTPGEGLSGWLVRERVQVGRNETVFIIETDDLPPVLAANPDRPPHCLIEPAEETTLRAFQETLANTIDLWEPETGTGT